MENREGTNMIEWLRQRGGWRAERRASPLLAHAVGAGGGALIGLGVIVIGFDQTDPDGSGTVGALLSAALVVVALVVMARVPGPARSASVAAILIGVPSTWFFLLTVESDNGSTTGMQLLTTAVFAVLFLVGPTRGRAVLLGGALLFTWTFITGEVADTNEFGSYASSATEPAARSPEPRAVGGDNDPFSDEFEDEFSDEFEEDFEFSDDFSDDFDDDFDDDFQVEDDPYSEGDTAGGVTSLVIGGAYLAAAWALDRRRLDGLATPFVAIGVLAAVVGGVAVGADAGATGGGLIAVGVGAVVGWVGAQGRNRRASVWLGSLSIVVGVTVIANEIAGFDDSAVGFAVLVIALGLAISVGTVFLGRVLGEPDDAEAEAEESVGRR